MKQILQNLSSGETMLAEVPTPQASSGEVVIRSCASLVSAGTERMLVEFSKANLIQKARQQPEKVQMVLDKMKTDGVLPTLDAVFRKLDEPMPLGYCNAGIVISVGKGVTDLSPGDRVASNGAHAEVVCVPRNLCAKIPDSVGFDEAAFTVLASIALEGVRVAETTLGEVFVVFGLGLVGLLVVQLLRASGCQVLAVDLNPARLALAEKFGAEVVNLQDGGDPVSAGLALTDGTGVDGAILCAAAPDNQEIIHQAAEACRKGGRIVLVGKVGLQLRHVDFFQKGLSLKLSTSYGPGRYDESYEEGGHDYPIAHVRWTEGRNFQAILGAMDRGEIKVDALISDRVALADAAENYVKILDARESLGVVLTYPEAEQVRTDSLVSYQSGGGKKTSPVSGSPTLGLIGAGGFARGVLVPALRKSEAQLKYVASKSGVSAHHLAKKFGVEHALSDYRKILDDDAVDVVFVLTGHASHARFVTESLEAGKHVFVEKPLAISREQLAEIEAAYAKSEGQHLLVGFNRRFSPHAQKARQLLAGRVEPLCLNLTINAGAMDADHWMQDMERGGGRIIGEGCHFIDLMVFLTGSSVAQVSAMRVGSGVAVRDDKMTIQLTFADGSIGVLNYFSNGSKRFPKERIEIFSEERVILIDNFKETRGYGFKGFKKLRTLRQDKGHEAEMEAFTAGIAAGDTSLIPFEQLKNVTIATFAAIESAQCQNVVKIL